MLTLPLGLYPEGYLIMGYIAGLFVQFNDLCKRVKLLVPGVGWWIKFFDVEPRGEQKVMSNSPTVPLGGAAGVPVFVMTDPISQSP